MSWLIPTFDQIWPNLVASAIWAIPAFTIHHILIRNRMDRHHRIVQDMVASLRGRED